MSASPTRDHPLVAGVKAARRSISGVAEVEPVYMRATDKADALVEIAALRAQVDELEMRVLAASGDLAQDNGARDAGQWLAHETHLDPRTCHGELKLAEAIDQKWRRVADGMRAGSVNRVQAQVIVAALEKLPPEIDQVTRRRAEKHLVELSGQFGPRELRILGDRILAVVAPEVADDADAKALEREEQRARIKTSIKVKQLGEGMARIIADIPVAAATRFVTYLDAYTSPRSTSVVEPAETMPRHRKLGHAFCALLEHLDPANLPDHGGDATTVMVTISLENLRRDLASAGAWSKGGKTDLADGVLLCSHHHHVAHDPRMTHDLTPTGAWRFHRRP